MYHPIVQCPWVFLSLKMREVSEETKGLSVSQPFRRSKGAVRWLVTLMTRRKQDFQKRALAGVGFFISLSLLATQKNVYQKI